MHSDNKTPNHPKQQLSRRDLERPDLEDELVDDEYPPYPLPAGVFERPTHPKPTQPSAHPPVSERPDSIPFEQVADAAFKAFNHKGQEIDLECGLEVHQRADQADAAVVAEVIIPKVDSWQAHTYGRVILGQDFTMAKVSGWCSWWIAKHLRQKGSPPDARKRGYTASQAQRGRDTQTRRANHVAAQAQALRLQGLTCTQIAARLGRCIRGIRYAFKRFVDPGLVQRFLNGVQSVQDSSTGRSIQRVLKTKGPTTWFTNSRGVEVELAYALPNCFCPSKPLIQSLL